MKIPYALRSKVQKGYTIIELMVAISLISVLLGVGVPSSIYWIDEARLRQFSSDLQADMFLARSQAVRLNCTVSVTAKERDYLKGWTVRYNGVVDATGATTPMCNNTGVGGAVVTLSDQGAYTGLASTAIGSIRDPIIYSFDGRALNTELAWEVHAARPGSSSRMRCIFLSPSGRPSVVVDNDDDKGNGCLP